MASLSGFPFRLTPLMAKTLSPMWMAPVLQSEEKGGGAEVQDYTRQVASLLTQTQTMRLLVTEPQWWSVSSWRIRNSTEMMECVAAVSQSDPPSPLTPSHRSARPFLVRPEMTMGSKGSSVPEMVMPSGPLYLFSSTV